MSKNLRILVGADQVPNPNSGAAGTVLDTNRALAALGHEVEAFWADAIGRRIRHGNAHYLIELPRAYRREVRRRLDRQTADVVQLSQPFAYLAGKHVLTRQRRPVMVWRSHGLEAKVEAAMRTHMGISDTDWRTPLRRLAAWQLDRTQHAAVRNCDGMIVPCADDKTFLVEHFAAQSDRVQVIWHGVPDEYIDAPVPESPARWQRLLHVSQMSANKGNQIMLEAAADALRALPTARMTWVCPIAMHPLIEKTIEPALMQRVLLLDWVSREALRALYDEHGLFLFATIAEGAAKTVMEAMARGMCVVSSDTSGPSDYIRHGENGYLAPVGQASDLGRLAIEALRNPQTAMRMGAAAQVTARAFRWSRCAAQAVDFYRDLAERKRQAQSRNK